MTDDKGAGEGPYKSHEVNGKCQISIKMEHGSAVSFKFFCSECGGIAASLASAAHADGRKEGRKEERERCAKIAEDSIPTHSHCEDGYKYECYTGHIIADKIRGGQDGE